MRITLELPNSPNAKRLAKSRKAMEKSNTAVAATGAGAFVTALADLATGGLAMGAFATTSAARILGEYYKAESQQQSPGQAATNAIVSVCAEALARKANLWNDKTHLEARILELRENIGSKTIQNLVQQIAYLDVERGQNVSPWLSEYFASELLKGASAKANIVEIGILLNHLWNDELRRPERSPLNKMLFNQQAANDEVCRYIYEVEQHGNAIVADFEQTGVMDEDFALADILVPVMSDVFVGMDSEPELCFDQKHTLIQTILRKTDLKRPFIELITGGPGMGKSSIAKAVATHFVKLGWGVLFVPLQRLEVAGSYEVGKSVSLIGFNGKTLATGDIIEVLRMLPIRKFLIVCDGLDELGGDSSQHNLVAYQIISKSIADLIMQANEEFGFTVRFLLCGRPNAAEVMQSHFAEYQGITIRRHRLWRISPPLGQVSQITNLTFRQGTFDKNSQFVDYRGLWWEKFCRGRGLPTKGLPKAFSNSFHSFVDEMGEPLLLYLMTWSAMKERQIDESAEDCFDRVLGDGSAAKPTNRSDLFERVLQQVYKPLYDSIDLDIGTRVDGYFGKRLLSKMPYKDFCDLLQLFALTAWAFGGGRVAKLSEVSNVAKLLSLNSGGRENRLLSLTLMDVTKDLSNSVLSLLSVFYWTSKKTIGNGGFDEDEEMEFTHKSLADYLVARSIVSWGFNLNNWFGGDDKTIYAPLGTASVEIAELAQGIISSRQALSGVVGNAFEQINTVDWSVFEHRGNLSANGVQDQTIQIGLQASSIINGINRFRLSGEKTSPLEAPTNFISRHKVIVDALSLERGGPTFASLFLSHGKYMNDSLMQTTLRSHRVEDAAFGSCDFVGLHFEDCTFRDCLFHTCRFTSVQFTNSLIQSCKFIKECIFIDCDFSQVEDCWGNIIDDSTFERCTFSNGFVSDNGMAEMKNCQTQFDVRRSKIKSCYRVPQKGFTLLKT